MRILVGMLRWLEMILAGFLVSPTDEWCADRHGFGRAYIVRTRHGKVHFSGMGVL